MWITIISCVISSAISVLLSDKIITGVSKVLMRLGLSKVADISGIWKATFDIGRGAQKAEYVEIIQLKNRLGVVWGHIYPHPENYARIERVYGTKTVKAKRYAG